MPSKQQDAITTADNFPLNFLKKLLFIVLITYYLFLLIATTAARANKPKSAEDADAEPIHPALVEGLLEPLCSLVQEA